MGKTAFSGPVYGAKGTLFSGNRAVVSTGTSLAVQSITVPAYEDWVVTELIAQASTVTTTGGTPARISLLDDSTNIVSTNFASTSASIVKTLTPTAGEYEGYVVSAGSSLVVAIFSGSSGAAMGEVNWTVRGFTRYISSTRSE